MFKIGCHLSSSKGFLAMGKEANSIGANTFQFFTRNPRGGKAKALNKEDIDGFVKYAKEEGIISILAHAPYTVNACAKDVELRNFAIAIIKDDLDRLEHIPGCMYNFHPGSHVNQGTEVGIAYVAQALNDINSMSFQTPVLIETMAGKGTELGRNFQEIQRIIEQVENSDRLGVCLDTCHVFDGGYDIITDLDEVLNEFDRIIGLQRLQAIHLNDSKNVLGSHKDRHEQIGKGNIGQDAFSRMINHPKLKELPFYLETPNDIEGYRDEISLLKELRKN